MVPCMLPSIRVSSSILVTISSAFLVSLSRIDETNLSSRTPISSMWISSGEVDSDVVESDSKSCGYPVQLYKVLIFFTSNLDNSPSFLSLKVTKFQKEFWISFYVLKMSKISVCQPFCFKTAQMESISFIIHRIKIKH